MAAPVVQWRQIVQRKTAEARASALSAAKDLENPLASRMVAIFETQGVKKGGVPDEFHSMIPWKPTSRVALIMRKNPVYNPDSGGWHTLVDTGALFRSIRAQAKRTRFGATLRLGTRSRKGKTHQYGGFIRFPGSAAGAEVPRRPFLYWNHDDLELARKAWIARLNHG